MDVRILVVEDDPKIASFVAGGLKQHGFAVDLARDGDEALALAGTTPFDAAVVDVMLPRLDGLSLVKRLRAARNALPVLFLSARSSVDDRISGLQAGGDDYLTKPFAFSELLARVQALMRRASRAPEATRLVAGDLELDLATRDVRARIRNSSMHINLLDYLITDCEHRIKSRLGILKNHSDVFAPDLP